MSNRPIPAYRCAHCGKSFHDTTLPPIIIPDITSDHDNQVCYDCVRKLVPQYIELIKVDIFDDCIRASFDTSHKLLAERSLRIPAFCSEMKKSSIEARCIEIKKHLVVSLFRPSADSIYGKHHRPPHIKYNTIVFGSKNPHNLNNTILTKCLASANIAAYAGIAESQQRAKFHPNILSDRCNPLYRFYPISEYTLQLNTGSPSLDERAWMVEYDLDAIESQISSEYKIYKFTIYQGFVSNGQPYNLEYEVAFPATVNQFYLYAKGLAPFGSIVHCALHDVQLLDNI